MVEKARPPLLLDPHDPMPFLDLALPEVEDLRAYIQSLSP